MRFTISTKPLKNVTSLGIIKANISQYFYRSNVVQITATRDTLKINIEASGIKTRMVLRGSGDEDTTKSVMVECLKFKNLIDSIDNDVITLEFIDGGLFVHAGSSKFAIPQLMDTNDAQLNEPVTEYVATNTITINPADWQFVKDHQMYAISTQEKHPVYKNVWVSANKEVLVGDIDLSMFTYAKCGEFDTTCLLPPSLVNLFISIPEGSTISKIDKNYVLSIDTDSYSMVTEFTPKYEEDETVGSYHSEIILGQLVHPEKFITIDVAPILKFISQTSIVNQADTGKIIGFTIEQGKLTLTNRTSRCVIDVDTDASYTVNFATVYLKNVLSNLDADQVNIAPMIRTVTDESGKQVDMAMGCLFWTENITTLLAGQG